MSVSGYRKFGKVNQKAIARELGVSQSLISKILSGKNEASKEMTAKILKVVGEKGYRPNMLVRGMQTGKTGTIGVVVPANDSFHAGIVEGVHDQLDAAGYAMIFVWNKENIASPDSRKELEYIHRLVDRRVEGVILRPTHDEVSDMYFAEIAERGIPLVIVDRELSRTNYDFVGTDDEAGGEMAAKHLLELGHRRLGQLAGPSPVSTASGRRIGFEKAVAAYGNGAVCTTVEAPQFRDVRNEILQLLRTEPRPTAVFGANDYTAHEIYEVAATLGLRIPGDLAVVGFGDLPFGSFLAPTLTTIRQDPYRIGMEAARVLLHRCAGKPESARKTIRPEKIRLKPELVARGSTDIKFSP